MSPWSPCGSVSPHGSFAAFETPWDVPPKWLRARPSIPEAGLVLRARDAEAAADPFRTRLERGQCGFMSQTGLLGVSFEDVHVG